MNKYYYKYGEDTFTLTIEKVFLKRKELCDITKLYINDIILLENKYTKTDFYFEIIKMMINHDSDSIQERLIQKEYSNNYSLFTGKTLYFKKNKNDNWNVMDGKDYDNFYDWLTIFLSPEAEHNNKKKRRVKLNNILNNAIE